MATIQPTTNTDPTPPPPQSTREQWSLATDIVTVRTAIFLNEHLKRKQALLLEQQQQQHQSEQQQQQPTSYPCGTCLLSNHHCVCPEFPNRQELTNSLNQFLDVVVYAHSSEVAGLTASNTAHFLPHHGAYPVFMGDLRSESILRNLIFSRPRDSVFVLFPSPTSITPMEFMEKYHLLTNDNNNNVEKFPFLGQYPPINPMQNEIEAKNAQIDIAIAAKREAYIADQTNRAKKLNLTKDPLVQEMLSQQKERVYYESKLANVLDDDIASCFPSFYSTRDFYTAMTNHYSNNNNNNNNTNHIKPLVIVLDGTWSNAKSLDRRLALIVNEVFNKNYHSERERLLTDPSITPNNYLHRVRVTRALRSDVGQLRRLQTSERGVLAGAGLGFKTVTSFIPAQAMDAVMADRHQATGKDIDISMTTPITAATPTKQSSSPSSSTTTTTTTTTMTTNPHTKIPTILQDDDAIEDTSGGRVSTLHAFLVLLEEMYDLPIIASHRSLNQDKAQIKETIRANNDPNFDQKSTILDVVAGFTQILQATVIGYHTQKGLSKAQLLDPETRQLVKTKYQDFLDRKEETRAQTRNERRLKRDETQGMGNDHNGNGDEAVSSQSESEIEQDEKRQKVDTNGNGDADGDQLVSIVGAGKGA